MDDAETRDGPPKALIIAALAVAVAAIGSILVFAALRQAPATEKPVAIVSVPAPQADSADCRALIDNLPERLGNYQRASAADPAPPAAAAWRATPDGEAVILRCGLDRPAEFVLGSPLQVVDDVSWFEIADQGRSTWFAVDRPVYVALTLPADSGPTPIQEISRSIAKSLPAKPVDPGPVR
ncbi:DUF3515 domain-containing protein [Mycobacterium sp. NPDC051804]|uniref:DUF3515 domain-containing protein n=1 Tax=Mycobacterium sp. NPDC051804 TaxID=3364295 RepID=UPI00378E6CAE